MPCTCHYEAAEFCRHHAPLLRAQREAVEPVSNGEIASSLKAVFSALSELQAALERGGFLGGVSSNYTNLVTNLGNKDPSNQEQTPPPTTPPPLGYPYRAAPPSSPAREVFEHWCGVMGKNANTVFDRKRQRAVATQLKAGRTVDELKRAVDGCKMDPFSMGQNDRAQVFNDFNLIFRDAAHVEKFLAIADGSQKPVNQDPAKVRADAAAERRKLDTRRILERQQDTAGRTDPNAAKQRLADLVAKVGTPIEPV